VIVITSECAGILVTQMKDYWKSRVVTCGPITSDFEWPRLL